MRNSPISGILLRVIKKNSGLSLLLAVAVVGVVTASLIPPQILKMIVDRNLVSKSADGLLVLAIAYMAAILFSGAFDFMKEAILTVFGQRFTKELRAGMTEKLEKINAGFFSANSSGAVVSRFTNDVDAINSLFTGGIISMVIDCFKIIGIVISIWFFSPRLGLVTLVLIPIIYWITRFFQQRMLKAQIENRILISRVNNHISESLKNVRMIKAYGKERYMEENYTGFLADNYKTVEKVNFYDSVFSPVIQLVRAVFIILIVILSSGQLNYLGISLGMVAASIEFVSNLFAPIESLGMELQNIQQAISGVHRVNDFFSEREDSPKNEDITAAGVIPDRENVRITFHDVSFQYENSVEVLKNINLDFERRANIAFVGRTGVGKTTLFKLLTGLMKPTAGAITVNGFDVCDIPNYEKRKIFGYVDQSAPLLKGTVAEQVSLKDSGITNAQIEAALDFVGLTEYVTTLENGMDTPVTAALFSQGQKQLLAIARAIVTDPPVLLLDEITANLDSITEDRIVSVLRKASSSHTILSISHRLTSMLASDTVVILENGSVKNTGSPEQLLQTDDWYRSRVTLEKLVWS